MKLDNGFIPGGAFWNASGQGFRLHLYRREQERLCGRFLDRVLRKDVYQRFDWVMDQCGDLAGKTACDIGCGPGHFVSEFAQRGAALCMGLDIAPNMLALASDRALHAGVAQRCEFALSDVAEWKTNHRFDLTVAIGLWDYIQDPRKQLRHIRRLTRGRFLSAWPRLWTWRMPIRKMRLHYLQKCPVDFYRQPEVCRMLRTRHFPCSAATR